MMSTVTSVGYILDQASMHIEDSMDSIDVTSESFQDVGEIKEIEGIKEALLEIAQAIREWNAMYEKVNQKLPISEAEVWKLLEDLKIEDQLFNYCYLYLIDHPNMVGGLIGCPNDKRKELLLLMVFGSSNPPRFPSKTWREKLQIFGFKAHKTHQTEMNHTGTPDDQQTRSEEGEAASEMAGEEEFKNGVCHVCKNRRPRIGEKRELTYGEVYGATEGFCAKNFVSEGGVGAVYKGELHGMKIAVKKQRSGAGNVEAADKEFKCEVDVLSSVRHENVVVLLGSCSEGSHRLLVYEYVCNGSLNQHLSEYCRKPLSWQNRIKIAVGAAKGLLYLHHNNIIHRDITPNNILVTHDYETLLGDFGLATRVGEEESSYSGEICVGNEGYLAPEFLEFGKLSTKTDVYSFGVILLHLITGMRITDKKRLGDKTLVEWARPLLEERKCGSLIDKRIMKSHDCHQFYCMSQLAQCCLTKDPHKRLTMATVVEALSDIMEGCTCSHKECNARQSFKIEVAPNGETQPLLYGEEESDSIALVGGGVLMKTSTDSSKGGGGDVPQLPKSVSGYWSEGSSNFTASKLGLEVEEVPFESEWL
ncbi:proline-rich receptor-like protein kinase PERK8 [Senna tora]|uniref:non-specific serine/threonine protein kinase n=1 Tax=Senna tora TaxID=362788 RepID=A0A834WMK7_9FABA|nr:proline-rich receptor-like protein kinase PERK8 [Senna tora]